MLSYHEDIVTINPQLPPKWESVAFNICLQGQSFSVEVNKTSVKVKASNKNLKKVLFNIRGQVKECNIGTGDISGNIKILYGGI